MNIFDADNKFIPPTELELISTHQRITRQSYRAYIRLFQGAIQPAILNNLYACELGSGLELSKASLRSGLGNNLARILNRKICGRVFYESAGDSKEAKNVISESYITKKLKTAFSKAIRTGRCVIALYGNKDNETDKARLETYDLFHHKLVLGPNGIESADLFINVLNGETIHYEFYVVEKRYYKEGKPYQKFVVLKASWGSKDNEYSASLYEYKKLDELSQSIQERLAVLGIKLYQERELEGYTDLGVYNIDNTVENMHYPDSDIPESQYADVLDMLYEVDLSRTYKEIDKNIGRGRVILPSTMNTAAPSQFTNPLGNSNNFARIYSTPIDKTFFTQYEGKAMQDCKPDSIQFALRTAEWRMDIEGTIGDVCSAFGISVLDYDPRILQAGQRTDDEINAMTDITYSTVCDKREINEESINKMLACICSIYGLDTPLTIRWSMSSILNPTKNTMLIGQQLQQGTISKHTAIKRLNPDLSDNEIEEEEERLSNERTVNDVTRNFDEF